MSAHPTLTQLAVALGGEVSGNQVRAPAPKEPVATEDFADLPDAMKHTKRWLVWKSETNPDPAKKPRKVPFYVGGRPRQGVLDSPEDRAALGTFEDAIKALSTGNYAGLGFALGQDGPGVWQGVDLDHIHAHSGLDLIAEDLPGYVETSPSGSGVHAIGYGRSFTSLGSNSTGIEAYSHGRYFTVTGQSRGLGDIVCIADFVKGRLAPLHGNRAQDTSAPGERVYEAGGALAGAMAVPDLRSALAAIPSDDREVWIRMGMALKALGEQGRTIWIEWSARSDKYDAEDAGRVWDSLKPTQTGYGAVFAEAQRRGWQNPAAAGQQAFAGLSGTIAANPSDPPPRDSDEALALVFAARHQDDLRYTAAWGKWHFWTGTRWQVDDTRLAIDRARAVCREAANVTAAKAIASARAVTAVEGLARSDRRLAATAEQWDADPWILNTPGGVVDLKTGLTRPHDPADHLTKITGAAPGGGCPLFLKSLSQITGSDPELTAFIQRTAGYALTGDTSAHALFFAYGTGANGKGVLINTLAGILGDYHKTAPIETFTASTSERHPTDLAGLRGARLVTASETEEGRRWDEAKIKAITGGDMISARLMRQDFFEFRPQFKLLIAGNHRPGLRSVDEAMRRRLNLIPFNVTIPADERDEHLAEKLKAEWPGILAWMIQGCLDWQRGGLCPPEAVLKATSDYLESEDAVGRWLADASCQHSGAWTPSNELFASWKAWCDASGEYVGTGTHLTQKLIARGFQQSRKNIGRGVQGLGLRDNKPIGRETRIA